MSAHFAELKLLLFERFFECGERAAAGQPSGVFCYSLMW
jgi:hypothetical protein